jgi:hypothetical protein
MINRNYKIFISLLAPFLNEIGYSSINEHTFEASWYVGDVQNLLFCERYPQSKDSVFFSYGFRNSVAERFGLICIKRYGLSHFSVLDENSSTSCAMRFELGRAAEWGIRGALALEPRIEETLFKLKQAMETIAIPLAQHNRTKEELFNILVQDDAIVPWAPINAAVRMAQIAMVGRFLDRSSNELASLLSSLRPRFIGIHRTVSPDQFFMNSTGVTIPIDRYIENVIRDAEAFET